jgi:hypothetical protein
MKIVDFSYLHGLYYYLLSMTDSDLDDFSINDAHDRIRLYNFMRLEYEKYGPKSKRKVLNTIEFSLQNENYNKSNIWRNIIPHELPIYDIDDRKGYLMDLYKILSGEIYNFENSIDNYKVFEDLGLNGINIQD